MGAEQGPPQDFLPQYPVSGAANEAPEAGESIGGRIPSGPEKATEALKPTLPELDEVSKAGADPWVDQYRLSKAQELGLPENSSWQVIGMIEDRRERALIAKELGWIEDPKVTAKLTDLGLDPLPTWRNLLTTVLGLQATVSADTIVEQIQKSREDPT